MPGFELLKGLFSRAARAVNAFPEKINANKASSILKSATSAEELGYRGLTDFLSGNAGSPVYKSEMKRILDENPIEVAVKRYGEPSYSDTRYTAGGPPDTPTNYSAYQLEGSVPGTYREDLIKLQRPTQRVPTNIEPPPAGPPLTTDELADINRTYGTPVDSYDTPPYYDDDGLGELLQPIPPTPSFYPINYTSQHWPNEENIIAHVRHNERVLPDATRGRMLENVQSDWHQKGAHFGYYDPVKEREADDLASKLSGDVQRFWKQYVTDELARPIKTLDEWVAEQPEAVRALDLNDIRHPAVRNLLQDFGAYREGQRFRREKLSGDATFYGARDLNGQLRNGAEDPRLLALQEQRFQLEEARNNAARAASEAAEAPPDAPFKDNRWVDLALKQQLLDVAHNGQTLDWIGIPTAKVLKERGEEVSPQFQENILPKALAGLLKPFGGNVERTVLRQEPNFRVRTNEQGQVTVPINDWDDEAIASVWPRVQGAEDGYERAAQLANEVIRTQGKLTDIEGFIARLTPEMKQAIREKGFPMLLALMGLQGMNMSEDYQDASIR